MKRRQTTCPSKSPQLTSAFVATPKVEWAVGHSTGRGDLVGHCEHRIQTTPVDAQGTSNPCRFAAVSGRRYEAYGLPMFASDLCGALSGSPEALGTAVAPPGFRHLDRMFAAGSSWRGSPTATTRFERQMAPSAAWGGAGLTKGNLSCGNQLGTGLVGMARPAGWARPVFLFPPTTSAGDLPTPAPRASNPAPEHGPADALRRSTSRSRWWAGCGAGGSSRGPM